MSPVKEVDAYGREVSQEEKTLIEGRLKDPEDNTITLWRSFQIKRELRNAVSNAKKILSESHSEEFIDLVTKRLRKRGLEEEAVETALLTLKKSLRR